MKKIVAVLLALILIFDFIGVMKMSERNYYVFCDDNCKFPAMTKEQVIAAIAEATGETPTHIDDAFITKIREKNNNAALSFWVGTQAQYNAIEGKEQNCFYILTDDTSVETMEIALEEMGLTVDSLAERVQALETEAQKKDVVLFDKETAGHFLQVGDVINNIGNYAIVNVGDVRTGNCLCRVYEAREDDVEVFRVEGLGNGVLSSQESLWLGAINISINATTGQVIANNSNGMIFIGDTTSAQGKFSSGALISKIIGIM